MFKGSEQEKRLIKVQSISIVSFALFMALCKLLAGDVWNSGFFGERYWQMLTVAVLILIFASNITLLRVRNGKTSYVFTAIEAVSKYSFLIKQLTRRDFKTKYKRSVLGVLWSFLNPLLMMSVQYIIFSTLFKNRGIPNFAAYLVIGNVCFNFFNESTNMTLNSIVGNAGLITKVYMPKYIYPLTRTISSLVNLAISLIPLLAVCIISGVRFTATAFLSIYYFACLFIFCLGMGMLLSCIDVFFRDTQFLWGIMTTIWMYFTPIFYPVDIIPQQFLKIYTLNPMYVYIYAVRNCIMYGTAPLPGTFLKAILEALFMLAVGAAVFKKGQDRFVLYL